MTLIDAVVAIAITLLVLPLAEMTVDLGADQSVADLLDEHQAELLAFPLSFVVIARLWYSQHATVRYPAVPDQPGGRGSRRLDDQDALHRHDGGEPARAGRARRVDDPATRAPGTRPPP